MNSYMANAEQASFFALSRKVPLAHPVEIEKYGWVDFENAFALT